MKPRWSRVLWGVWLFVTLLCTAKLDAASAAPSVEFPGPPPGKATVTQEGGVWTLRNDDLLASWEASGAALHPVALANLLSNQRFSETGREVFRVSTVAAPGAYDLPASSFRLVSGIKAVSFRGDRHGARLADRLGGVALEAELVSDRGIQAHWRTELRDGSNYLRQTLTLFVAPMSASTATAPIMPLLGVEMMDIAVPNAQTIGSVSGCPVAGGGLFFGVEMPGAQNALDSSGARIGFASRLELSAAHAYTFGAVAGVAPPGQLRRAFLFYLERERARPAQPFLHYNDWYDLGLSVNEASLLDAAAQFDKELRKKRGVALRSYLVDDGWDNPTKDLWQENPTKFPDGFRGTARKLAAFGGARMSLWISPLGGYSYADQRTEHARAMGLLPPGGELDFSQPAYEKWFEDRCLQLMRDDGVNGFKWDRAGNGVSPHFMALLGIAAAVRKQDPDVFLNVTVGTWPSPFWLNYVDSTWRTGSADVGWAGVGDDREQWLTYRDGQCHRLFVEKSPLYPLNAVMHHGIVEGRLFQGARVGKTGPHLKNEARSYFANGTMLQELYITPSLMTDEAWDCVAEAAKWAQANADVLVDSHWVGGDPLRLEPYGYAAWNRRKGTLMVRNPDAAPHSITLDAPTVFELPDGAPTRYTLTTPYADQRVQTVTLDGTKGMTLTLQPFEVLVFDAYGK